MASTIGPEVSFGTSRSRFRGLPPGSNDLLKHGADVCPARSNLPIANDLSEVTPRFLDDSRAHLP